MPTPGDRASASGSFLLPQMKRELWEEKNNRGEGTHCPSKERGRSVEAAPSVGSVPSQALVPWSSLGYTSGSGSQAERTSSRPCAERASSTPPCPYSQGVIQRAMASRWEIQGGSGGSESPAPLMWQPPCPGPSDVM